MKRIEGVQDAARQASVHELIPRLHVPQKIHEDGAALYKPRGDHPEGRDHTAAYAKMSRSGLLNPHRGGALISSRL